MSATATTVPIFDVHVEPGLNARRQEEESELEALRDSVARHGVLQPLLVRPRDEGGVWLVAGHRRLAAAQLAELPEVPVVEVAGERLELTAVENLQRAQLSPLEEARAFKSLADAGRSRKGIAQALSVAPRRVTERLAILELTDAGQHAVGDGSLPLSAVSVLVEVTQVSVQLADRVLAFALKQPDPGALVRDPGWMVARAVGVELSEAAELGWLPTHRRIPLAVLGIEDEALVAKAEAIAASSYDRAGVRLTEEDLTRAIAGRCGWADERGTGVISRDWLAEQAPELVEAEWQEREAELAQRAAARQTGGRAGSTDSGGWDGAASQTTADPEAEARAALRARAAEDRRSAAAVNDELAAKLLTGLASAAWDRDAATFVAHTLLERGSQDRYGALTNTAQLAAQGLRYLLPELRDEIPVAKRGAVPKISYPDAREAERRFWQWFERAKTPEEILGRLLVAYAAAANAREEVVARSHRHGDFRPNAGAAKAFECICRKHLPASLKRFAAKLDERGAAGA